MKIQNISELKEGDKIFHVSDERRTLYTVLANCGDRVTAVKVVDVTNPQEWEIAAQAAYRLP